MHVLLTLDRWSKLGNRTGAARVSARFTSISSIAGDPPMALPYWFDLSGDGRVQSMSPPAPPHATAKVPLSHVRIGNACPGHWIWARYRVREFAARSRGVHAAEGCNPCGRAAARGVRLRSAQLAERSHGWLPELELLAAFHRSCLRPARERRRHICSRLGRNRVQLERADLDGQRCALTWHEGRADDSPAGLHREHTA